MSWVAPAAGMMDDGSTCRFIFPPKGGLSKVVIDATRCLDNQSKGSKHGLRESPETRMWGRRLSLDLDMLGLSYGANGLTSRLTGFIVSKVPRKFAAGIYVSGLAVTRCCS